jgi:hypothetical protein
MSGPAGWRGCRQVSGDGAGTTTGPPGTTLARARPGAHDQLTWVDPSSIGVQT